MGTTTAAHFEPTTDTFGRLTLKAHRRVQALPTNLMIVLAFFSVLVLAIIGLAVADSAVFEQTHSAQTYYGGVPLDYD